MAAQTLDQHVIIIGAGISGLVLAQGLKKAGIKFSIFEREVSMNYRSNEWTMAIHWSLARLENILPAELIAKLPSCNPDVPIEAGGNYPIIQGETGQLLAGVPYKRGLRVPRSKMRALCAEGIDVQYGKDLVDLAFNESGKGVVASFKDGSVVAGTMVVGTDGPRSKVREFAMHGADKAENSKFPVWHHNMTVCYGDAEKAKFVRRDFPTSYLALSQQSFHAFQSISSMPDGPDHPETWIFHLAMAWLGEAEDTLTYPQRLAMIKEKAAKLGEPARSAFTWMPEETLVHRADISYWVPKQWDNKNGRMTMVGDAAHPMPPYRGQGLNHSICDISNMLEALERIKSTTDLETEINAYDAECLKRGQEEVKCSVENGLMLHDWEKVKESPVFKDGFRPMGGHDKRKEVTEHEAIRQRNEREAAKKLAAAAAAGAPTVAV